MEATGDYIDAAGRSSVSGLADGPLMVIDALKMPEAERETLLQSVFVENPAGLEKMSRRPPQGGRSDAAEVRDSEGLLSRRQRRQCGASGSGRA